MWFPSFGLNEFIRFEKLMNRQPNAKFTPKRSTVLKNKKRRKKR